MWLGLLDHWHASLKADKEAEERRHEINKQIRRQYNMQYRILKYDLEVKRLNKKYPYTEIILKPHLRDSYCDWHTAILKDKDGAWETEFHLYPDACNNMIVEALIKNFKNKKKEIKMTREEAEKKLEAAKLPRNMNNEYPFLDYLEALGLIKFDKPEMTPVLIIKTKIEGADFRNAEDRAHSIINKLNEFGYKIVKNA